MHFPSIHFEKSVLCCATIFFSLLPLMAFLSFPWRPGGLRLIPLPHDSPQAREGSFHADPNVLFSRQNSPDLELFLPLCQILVFCRTAVHLSDITHSVPVLSTLICQMVAKPWMFSSIPGLERKLGPNTFLCRGSHQRACGGSRQEIAAVTTTPLA